MFARRIAQDDRVRFHLRGRAGIHDGIRAGLEIQRHGVAHHGEVLVVDGECGFGGGGKRGSEDQGGGDFHMGISQRIDGCVQSLLLAATVK